MNQRPEVATVLSYKYCGNVNYTMENIVAFSGADELGNMYFGLLDFKQKEYLVFSQTEEKNVDVFHIQWIPSEVMGNFAYRIAKLVGMDNFYFDLIDTDFNYLYEVIFEKTFSSKIPKNEV